MANPSVLKTERLRTARALALKEATERYNHELLPDEERLLLLDRIRRLRRAVETAAQTIDAQHSGLGRPLLRLSVRTDLIPGERKDLQDRREMAEEKDRNPFGEILEELLHARGVTVDELAERVSAQPGAPEITGEQLRAIMVAAGPGEFERFMAAFDEAVQHEN